MAKYHFLCVIVVGDDKLSGKHCWHLIAVMGVVGRYVKVVLCTKPHEIIVSFFCLFLIIIFSTDAFARRECSLLLPPVKEGRGIIQLRYAPRS